ncbi:TspO/MBR family protein [Falsiroseomonas sp. CW058]|uniref:TspO/MBR family protein n=1 Tax=Falsiroseomonas sp. CW058 TaxID=3388664 RepID=UPI003D3194AB
MMRGAGATPLAAGAALLVLLGVALTGDLSPGGMLRWYLGLGRPWWQPPDWVVPIVWGAIYVLIFLAARRAWRAAPDRRRGLALALGANLFLNFLWPLLFFAHRRPDWALPEAAMLTLSVPVLMLAVGRRAPGAGWWLLPYLLWTGFATALNLSLVRINAPFP